MWFKHDDKREKVMFHFKTTILVSVDAPVAPVISELEFISLKEDQKSRRLLLTEKMFSAFSLALV